MAVLLEYDALPHLFSSSAPKLHKMIIILLFRDITSTLLPYLLIITTMHQTKHQPPSQPISQELNNFFTLLHRDHKPSEPALMPFGRRLSVILSASENDSSQTEGQSLNGTAAVAKTKGRRGMEAIRDVLRELFRSELKPIQLELLRRLEGLTEELHEHFQQRISQTLASDHQPDSFLEQQPLKITTNHNPPFHYLQTSFQLVQMQQKLAQLQGDNAFLKNLIILANKSYESLQMKLSSLSLQRKCSVGSTTNRTKSKLSIEDVSSCNERSRSPRMRSHVALPKTEEVYRRMVKRVLREGNHSHTAQ